MIDTKEYDKTLPRKLLGAGALFTNTEDKILVVAPTYKSEWEIPGGTVEESESPKNACLREVKEELGVDLPIGGLLALNYREESESVSELLLFLFDGGVLTDKQIGNVKLPPDELSEFRFLTLDEIKDKVLPSLYELIKSGLLQRKLNHSQYTENSRTVDELG